MKNRKGSWPFKQTWYSLCSRHMMNYEDETCHMCQSGHWRYDVVHSISSFVYKNWPNFWIWWVNRKRRF